MPTFRLNFISDDKIIYRFIRLELPGDEDAMQYAETHADGRAMEVWCGAKLVKKYPKSSAGGNR